jgi:hypothetical protein
MSIIAKASEHSGESFVPAPAGLHRAICCDVVDLGMVTGQFGTKHLVRLIWQTEAAMPDGKPYLVDRRYTLSLDDRANLRRDLEAWRGRPFNLTEAAGFDLERLIGVPCALLVTHKPGRDGTRVFANVQTVLPPMAGAPLSVRDYIRVALRPQTPTSAPPTATPPPIGPSYPAPAVDPFSASPVTADDIPF